MLVQLDDDLVAALDAVATAQGVSRSELIRRGAAWVLSAADELEKERRHAEGYRKYPQESPLAEMWLQLAAESMPGDDW